MTRRLLAAMATTLNEHELLVGPLPRVGAQALIEAVDAAGLAGHGGAAFSTARKLRTVAAEAAKAGTRAVVVANGAEGEPASSKDHVLLHHCPHLVLDGLVLAARAVGADRAYLYATAERLEGPLAQALNERSRARSDRRDPVKITTVVAPESFISGQETAAVAAVNGGRALPTTTPPPVFVSGVRGRPTLVQNVETLCHLALIARYGADWYREAGTPDDPGTHLRTVSGSVRDPGVYEVSGGSTLGDVIGGAGGTSEPTQAVLIGGYHGAWVPWDASTARLPMTRDRLSAYGAAPGAGVLIALPTAKCGLQAGAAITAYLAGQNAGQCGPCRNGLPTLADHLSLLALGRPGPNTLSELERVASIVDGRGACHHPGGTVRLVRSTMRTFADEVSYHAAGRCLALEHHGMGALR